MVDRNDGKFNGNRLSNNDVKLGTELKPQIIFVFSIKIGENTTIILEHFFHDQFKPWHIKLAIYI